MPEKMEHYIGHPACTGKESEAERNTYRFLDAHGISYETFRHEAVFTMEDCAQMEKAIGAPICKNLFLCNRQQTQFYLLMLPRDKTFKTKLLSSELACARLSFADESHMTGMLGIHPGAVSPMGLINEKTRKRVTGDRPGTVVFRVVRMPSLREYGHAKIEDGRLAGKNRSRNRPFL